MFLDLSMFDIQGKKKGYLERFPEMTPRRKMFLDLSMFDIQGKKKGYSICKIVQNSDLPGQY